MWRQGAGAARSGPSESSRNSGAHLPRTSAGYAATKAYYSSRHRANIVLGSASAKTTAPRPTGS
jgi:hypothetical protein